MTLKQLGNELNKMYTDAPEKGAVTAIHLFGIKYANEINELGTSKKDVAKAAGIPESYGTEIGKGVRLAEYVTLK